MRSIRVRRNRNGMVTLAGLTAAELRSISTGAFLHAHEMLQKDDRPEAQAYYQSVVTATRGIDAAMYPLQPRTATRSERWAEVRFSQKLRRIIDEAVANRRLEVSDG